MYLPRNDGSVSLIEALSLLSGISSKVFERCVWLSLWMIVNVVDICFSCKRRGLHCSCIEWLAWSLRTTHSQSQYGKPVLSPCGNSIFAFMCFWWSQYILPNYNSTHGVGSYGAPLTILFWVEKSIELFIISGPSKWPLPSCWNTVSKRLYFCTF